MPAATRADLNSFLEGLRAVGVKSRSHKQRAEAVREYLRGFDPKKLQEFLGRVYLDALKSPSQTTGLLAPKARGGQLQRVRRGKKRR